MTSGDEPARRARSSPSTDTATSDESARAAMPPATNDSASTAARRCRRPRARQLYERQPRVWRDALAEWEPESPVRRAAASGPRRERTPAVISSPEIALRWPARCRRRSVSARTGARRRGCGRRRGAHPTRRRPGCGRACSRLHTGLGCEVHVDDRPEHPAAGTHERVAAGDGARCRRGSARRGHPARDVDRPVPALDRTRHSAPTARRARHRAIDPPASVPVTTVPAAGRERTVDPQAGRCGRPEAKRSRHRVERGAQVVEPRPLRASHTTTGASCHSDTARRSASSSCASSRVSASTSRAS